MEQKKDILKTVTRYAQSGDWMKVIEEYKKLIAMDPEDIGTNQQWYKRDLADRIQLPGVLQSQGFGNPITTETPWVLSLFDHFWYLREAYKGYGQSEDVKVPFLCQPKRH